MLVYADVLVVSRTSGTVAIQMIADEWEKQLIYNLGRYPKKEEKRK